MLPLRSAVAASRGGASLAVRIPAAPRLRQLLSAVGPLTGTSANRSDAPPLADPDEVEEALGADLDLLVDDGAAPGGEPSTVIDATRDPIRVLRRGAFRWPETER